MLFYQKQLPKPDYGTETTTEYGLIDTAAHTTTNYHKKGIMPTVKLVHKKQPSNSLSKVFAEDSDRFKIASSPKPLTSSLLSTTKTERPQSSIFATEDDINKEKSEFSGKNTDIEESNYSFEKQ